MKRLRVFLDANILFSASLSGGVILTVTEALRLRREALTAPLAVDEARRNLARKSPHALSRLEAVLYEVQVIPECTSTHGLNLPANDGCLLATAIAYGCTHFLSGDKRHFGAYYGQIIQGVAIISPSLLLVHPDFL